MKWVSRVSLEPSLEAAVEEAARGIRAALGDERPDLVTVFVSYHHHAACDRVPELMAQWLPAGVTVGCSAGAVIGDGREIEGHPGLSITGAVLPDVEVTPVLIDQHTLPDSEATPSTWEELVHVPAALQPHFLLLADPLSFDPEPLLSGLDAAFPSSTKVGGLASGGREAGANALYLGHRVHRSGVVGVALSGNIEVDTIVAQGCRPIGEPMFVTRCERNIICELDGRRPFDVLQELYQSSDPADRELFQGSLFVGVVMRERQEEYGQGDFLIRNILGADRQTGRLAVGARLREGTVVQFHLRDAKTSMEDLKSLLLAYERRSRTTRPLGSLLFSCLGRGRALYGGPDHDTGAFRRHLGDIPLGGFFCNGEIGPVHGTTFIHGYTSSFGLFRNSR